MPELPNTFLVVAPWAGLGLLALVFMANALGVLDQSVAVRELAATGIREPRAWAMVGAGRLVQLVAAPCLFFHPTRPFAAVVLALFLVGATLAVHAFWKAAPVERDRQLANCLKNAALIGGLLLAAAWRS